jgi:hypothetical protein
VVNNGNVVENGVQVPHKVLDKLICMGCMVNNQQNFLMELLLVSWFYTSFSVVFAL